jgi:hypothetical protein
MRPSSSCGAASRLCSLQQINWICSTGALQPRFNPRVVYVGFMVYQVTMGQSLLQVLPFSPVSIIPPMLHTHISFIYWHYMVFASAIIVNKMVQYIIKRQGCVGGTKKHWAITYSRCAVRPQLWLCMTHALLLVFLFLNFQQSLLGHSTTRNFLNLLGLVPQSICMSYLY